MLLANTLEYQKSDHSLQRDSNRTNNIDGAEPVRVAHNAILVSRMHLATIALICKQTTDNSRTGYPPEPRWRHLSGNRILFVPRCLLLFLIYIKKYRGLALSFESNMTLDVIVLNEIPDRSRT